MGHKKGVTNLLRVHNSFNRVVSSGEDGSIKIWDIHANQYCDGYTNSKIVGNKFNDNTEIIEPLLNLDNDHGYSVKHLDLNQDFLVSYSN